MEYSLLMSQAEIALLTEVSRALKKANKVTGDEMYQTLSKMSDILCLLIKDEQVQKLNEHMNA